jgi:hypothetical protein
MTSFRRKAFYLARGFTIFGWLICFGVLASAQGSDLVVYVESMHYPVIAEFANIQGDVTLEGGDLDWKVISGHPLLVSAATKNLTMWRLPLGDRKFRVRYHFTLVDGPKSVYTVPIGNRVDRFFRRLLRQPTSREAESTCGRGVPEPVTHYSIAEDKHLIDILIVGWFRCINTSSGL